MAERGTASVKVQRGSLGFTTAIASAVLEWLLIFLLFVDAVFSYLLNKFARYCELQTPCLICSRLDHVLGDEKPGFYRNLIFHEHQLEISSLVYCHVHEKLADVHGICEGCFSSFATETKSHAERYRFFVGKLGTDIECCVDQDPRIEGLKVGTLSTSYCSCCSEPWMSNSYVQRLLQLKSIESEFAEVNVPLPSSKDQGCLNCRNGLKRRRDKPSGLVASSHIGNCGFNHLSRIGYTDLKITSDSESEVPFSDDDDGSDLVCETDGLKEDFIAQSVLEPGTSSLEIVPKILIDDFTSEELIHQAYTTESSLLVPHMQSFVDETCDMIASTSAVAIGHSLEELSWKHIDQKADHSALLELILLNDVPLQSRVMEAPVRVLLENLETMETGVIGQASIGNSRKVSNPEYDVRITTEAEDLEQVSNDPSSLFSNHRDLSDGYKLAISNNGRQVSDMFAEQLIGRDSTRVNEDRKLLLSQGSAVKRIDLPLNDMCSKVAGNDDESKISDASSSTGIQVLQQRISIERNESEFESWDGSIVSEIEGESVVDRLKRQVEYDRKAMSVLYKELEEERSASAVAVNQVMAMITRLQEEKSALLMEALQYLRMMEGQAEYDVDALQKVNDLLTEREKEVHDLESELQFYRKKFTN